jgi:hypothetical protein
MNIIYIIFIYFLKTIYFIFEQNENEYYRNNRRCGGF